VENLSEREKLNKKIVREQQDSNLGAAVYGAACYYCATTAL